MTDLRRIETHPLGSASHGLVDGIAPSTAASETLASNSLSITDKPTPVTSRRSTSPPSSPRQRQRNSYPTVSAAHSWLLSNDEFGRIMDPSANIAIPAYFSHSVTESNRDRVEKESQRRSSQRNGAPQQRFERQETESDPNKTSDHRGHRNRTSTLIDALGIVTLSGTIASQTQTAHAEEHDEPSALDLLGTRRVTSSTFEDRSPPLAHPFGSHALEDDTIDHGSDGYLSATEGEEAFWGDARRQSIALGDPGRKPSQLWGPISPGSRSRTTSGESTTQSTTKLRSNKGRSLDLPSRSDSTTGYDRHSPVATQMAKFVEEEEYDGYEGSQYGTGQAEAFGGAPTSVRQLVQQARRLARPSSREFTAEDEQRLSMRKMERANDGLGLNLDFFGAGETGSVIETISRRGSGSDSSLIGNADSTAPPRLSRMSASEDETDGLAFASGIVSSPTAHSRSTTGSTSPASAYEDAHQAMPDHFSKHRMSEFLPMPLESPPLLLARTSSSPLMQAPTSHQTNPASGESNSPILPRPSPVLGFASSSSSPLSSPAAERSPSSSQHEASRRASVDHTSPRKLSRARQTSDNSELSTAKSSRRLSNFFAKLTSQSESGSSSTSSSPRGTVGRINRSNKDEIRRPAQKTSSPATKGHSTSFSASSRPSAPILTTTNSSPASLGARTPQITDGSLSPAMASANYRFPSTAIASPMQSRTWKSTMSGQKFDELLTEYGSREVKRQEVLWELCETEKSFVEALKSIMEAFALPLKDRRGNWLRGVPIAVSRLFDWASDIVYLHSQIADSLQKARGPRPTHVIIQFADAFRPFINQLEVHQPYLVRFEVVTRIIERMTADSTSDFGAFIRMQSGTFLGGMSLSSFLLKPVQRLMKYPLFFKQLCNLTPKDHPDHIATLKLLNETDLIIRVMQEVKLREDEYDEAKKLESKMHGLPEGFRLAQRDRRLLHQGSMRRVQVSDKDRAALLATIPAQSSFSVKPNSTDNSGLLPPVMISPWLESQRPLSSVSDSGSEPLSSQSGNDRDSWPSTVTTPDATPLSRTPVKSNTPIHTRSSIEPSQARRTSSSLELAPNVNKTPQPPQPIALVPSTTPSLTFPSTTISSRIKPIKTRAKESTLHVFVYTDIILFAVPSRSSFGGSPLIDGKFGKRPSSSSGKSLSSPKPHHSDTIYRIVDSVNVSSISSYADLTGRTEHDSLLFVNLLPLSSTSKSSATAMFLTLGPTAATIYDRRRWLDAFARCQSASAPFSRGSLLASNRTLNTPVTQAERAAHRSPSLGAYKSPKPDGSTRSESSSANSPRLSINTSPDAATEREEREWWALRFRKIRTELETPEFR